MATQKSKTNLACDYCRNRKSRCDGLRPTCTPCSNAKRECIYRPTPISLENDSLILSRLADIEARLQSVEANGRSALSRDLLGHQATPGLTERLVSCPSLHTASAFKMLLCWPRVRLNLTLEGPQSTTYLQEVDEQDAFPVEVPLPNDRLALRDVVEVVENLYCSLETHIPLYISDILRACPCFMEQRVVSGLWELSSRDEFSRELMLLDLRTLAISQLLVLALAFRFSEKVQQMQPGSHPQAVLSTACLTIALQKQWQLLSRPDLERIALTLLMSYCLVYIWARPFHALGLLQSLEPALQRYATRQPDDSQLTRFSKLYFILESDILTEFDGLASSFCLSALTTTSIMTPSKTSSPANDIDVSPDETCIENHIWLSLHQNRILHLLYGPSKAYAQPHELADIVRSLSDELNLWYRSQPLEQRFARDATTLSMNTSAIPSRLREIAFRYFSCVFLLHRPILYFFLHKEMEYTVRPPSDQSFDSSREPWILESCRDCIEAAALIIQFSSPQDDHPEVYRSWMNFQMLFAAYLVLLQVKAIKALEPIFLNIGDLDNFLNRVEKIYEEAQAGSVLLYKNLIILRNQRQNFEAMSAVSTGSHVPRQYPSVDLMSSST